MYVCLCHAISDREIRARCASSTACSVAQIYLARGVAPKCGKCVATMRALIAESRKMVEANGIFSEFSAA
jgi:bacterioferritin-associated ferredoxin